MNDKTEQSNFTDRPFEDEIHKPEREPEKKVIDFNTLKRGQRSVIQPAPEPHKPVMPIKDMTKGQMKKGFGEVYAQTQALQQMCERMHQFNMDSHQQFTQLKIAFDWFVQFLVEEKKVCTREELDVYYTMKRENLLKDQADFEEEQRKTASAGENSSPEEE